MASPRRTEDDTRHSAGAGRRPILVYDGECCVCRRSVQALGMLNWLDTYSCMPYADAVRQLAEVPPGELDAGVRMVFPYGRQMVGFEAARDACLRTPLLLPIGMVLLLPVVRWLGERGYQLVSRHRHDIPCR